TAEPDDPIALRALNNPTDIISEDVSRRLHGDTSPRPGDVLLRNDWYPVEQASGEPFRWVDNDAEIVLEGGAGLLQLMIDVEPASGVPLPMRLEVLDQDGSRVADYVISGRSKLTIPVDGGSQTRLLRLHADTRGVRSPGDPRTTTFRAF